MTTEPVFEDALASAFVRLANDAPVEVDPITMTAVAARGARARTRLGDRRPRWLVLVLVGLLALALVGVGVMIGSRSKGPNPFAVVPDPSTFVLPGPPAETVLVFGSAAGGLFVAAPDGSAAHPVIDDGWYLNPRLSRDRQWIATNAYSPSGLTLFVLHADGSIVLRLPATTPVAAFAWGSAGPSVAWLAASIEGSIQVIAPASGTTLMIPTGATTARALAWSPDTATIWWAGGGPGPTGLHDGIAAETVHAVRLDGSADVPRIVDQRSFTVQLDQARAIRELGDMAISPNGRTIAFRARIEGWLRSDLLTVGVDGGAVSYLGPPRPARPWLTAWSGLRWLADGSGVIAEVGATDSGIAQPTVVSLDGSPLRPIDIGPHLGDLGGVVEQAGPVRPDDPAVLVGGAQTSRGAPGAQVTAFDLYVADASGGGSHRVVEGSTGGDLH
jgi:hypothetical protein